MEEVVIVISELENPNPPDRRHCTILIFGHYYEYGPTGITVGLGLYNKNSKNVGQYPSGFTGKSVDEFDVWNNGWVASAFEAGWNDCWHYAEASTKFLGVKFPVDNSYRNATSMRKPGQELNNNYLLNPNQF